MGIEDLKTLAEDLLRLSDGRVVYLTSADAARLARAVLVMEKTLTAISEEREVNPITGRVRWSVPTKTAEKAAKALKRAGEV